MALKLELSSSARSSVVPSVEESVTDDWISLMKSGRETPWSLRKVIFSVLLYFRTIQCHLDIKMVTTVATYDVEQAGIVDYRCILNNETNTMFKTTSKIWSCEWLATVTRCSSPWASTCLASRSTYVELSSVCLVFLNRFCLLVFTEQFVCSERVNELSMMVWISFPSIHSLNRTATSLPRLVGHAGCRTSQPGNSLQRV